MVMMIGFLLGREVGLGVWSWKHGGEWRGGLVMNDTDMRVGFLGILCGLRLVRRECLADLRHLDQEIILFS